MRQLRRIFVAAAAVLCAGTAAAQSDPNIEVALTPVNTPVTLARPATGPKDPALVTLAAYRLTITNRSTSQLNRLYLRNAVASNDGGSDLVLWDSVAELDPALCTGFGTSTLNCSTSLSIAPNGGSASWVVVARSPKDGQNIVVTWSAGGYEGNGVGNGCCALTGDPAVTQLDDTASTTQNSKARSYLKNSGTSSGSSKLFTGDRYLTKPGDQTTTFVDVPSFSEFATYAIGTIEETVTPRGDDLECSAAGHFYACGTTKIDLLKPDGSRLILSNGADPSTDPTTKFVVITLRVDSTAILPGTNVANVQIRYTDDAGNTQLVGPCVNTPNTYPCIVDRGTYTGSAGKELKADDFWLIKNYRNGSFKVF